MTLDTMTWWLILCAVSGLNVMAWVASAALVRRRQGELRPDAWKVVRLQLLLSAGYVLGCAYRSALPVYDVQRQVLHDTWLSSVIVGRTVATIAELCFAAQWALLLDRTAGVTGSAFGRAVARAVVPMIVVAELCSWHAVLTTSNLGHVVEETTWGLTVALLVASIAALWPRCARTLRWPLLVCVGAGVAYVVYMFGVDVPMYWARWLSDEAQGRQYLSVAQGLADVSTRWVVVQHWDAWKSEVVWMSLYFSAAVWFSIGLIHAASLVHEPRSDLLMPAAA